MRTFTNFKIGRFVILIIAVLFFVAIFYLLFNWSKGPKAKEIPILVTGLGNFEPKNEKKRVGPGEYGEAYNLPPEQKNIADASEKEYGMNIACSDVISLDRAINDTRLEECKHWEYPYDLPKTSVIVIFYNEGFSVIMRTVHSVINRSPTHVLHEIILVDDFSDKEDLKEKLETYIEQFDGKVRLIRNKEREGLIQTRTRGAKEATGEVIIFLDAHCEVNTNWLPPLLAPIYRNRTIMTVPIIDKIDHTTFRYHSVYTKDNHFRGIFEWGMLYKEIEIPKPEQRRRAHNSEPYHSPTNAGGLFAINRQYFLELGAYDPNLLIWGGENFELSFKIWQCGGSIEWVPCSRVGHVYRTFMPYDFGELALKKNGSLIKINYKRIVETWFDDKYKEYFYTREPLARYLDMGDISEQLALKEKLQCKSFEWFMDNVAYDVFDKFPSLPPNIYWGELRSVATETCLSTMDHRPPSLMTLQRCNEHNNNQLMRLNAGGQLAVGERCVESKKQTIELVVCSPASVHGPWQYDEETQHLIHRGYQMCMDLHPKTHKLSLNACDSNNVYQQWNFKVIIPSWYKIVI